MKLSTFPILFALFILISFSCQQGSVEENSQVLTYSVDTVIIDSKGRILDVSGYMVVSDLDDHKGTFFLYNHHDLSIDEINLDKKEFVKTVSLDAEGPNGVGPYIFGLQFLGDNLLFAKSVPFSSVVDRNGHVVQKVNWLTTKDTNGIQFETPPPRSELVVNTKDWTVVGTNLDFRKKTAFLVFFSVKDNQVKNIDIDPKNSFKNYFLSADNSFYDPWVFLCSDENHISVSHLYSNEIILLNTEGEIVKVVNYEPKMTPSRADVPETLTGTRQEIGKEQQKLLEQVRFQAPVWDSKHKRYFRLSAKRIFTDESGNVENSRLSRTQVFLSVFDAEFNLISEMELVELYDENYKYFAKDGKLWVCQNFLDELGFLVFDF
ncbi:DUF4221 family protein [Belliella marina]|uniref:DUF4221 family protein n=1 Tax=Belliella marina TaxID=1644146 RepID=A0ABW4VM21_9BACT